MAKANNSYDQAIQRLEQIVAELEQSEALSMETFGIFSACDSIISSILSSRALLSSARVVVKKFFELRYCMSNNLI